MEDNMLIELGRYTAYWAFRPRYSPGQSPTAYFAGQKRPDNRALRSRNPQGDTKQERRLRRAMDYDQIHATQTRPPGFSRESVAHNQAIFGDAHRAIADLEALQMLWVQAMYRPYGPTRGEFKGRFRRAYFARYERAELQGCRTGTRTIARHLIAVALDNWGLNKKRPPEAIVGVSRETWKKTYKPHWQRISRDIEQIDRGAMLALGDAMKSMVA